MPTPFHHLRLAEDLLAFPGLAAGQREFLQAFSCAFLFGNAAPDVQVISGQPRQQTHFFDLPIRAGDPPAWERFLSDYLQLAETRKLPPSRTAFLAGYLCHLQADWIWVKEVFAPVFGPRAKWGTFRRRLYLHNALRAYLDVRILSELAPGTASCLGQVRPDGWLPFVSDQHLAGWREALVPQLRPGATGQTVEVFASRQGIPVIEFNALIESEVQMQQEVFSRLPLRKVQWYQQQVLDENRRLLSGYLAPGGSAGIVRAAGHQSGHQEGTH